MMKENSHILLVEDDHIDVMTIQRAMKDIQLKAPLHVAGNGVEALEFLNNADNPRPTLIILDLNMPRMNGLEFLEVVKADEQFKRIPVVVLTTSGGEHDRWASFGHSIAGYILKPVDYQNFVKVMRAIDNYWSMSELPG